MPSPFPGMDPYLEDPDFWPEVHHLLISVIAEVLVPQVRPKYRVAIEKRIYDVEVQDDQNGVKDNHQSLLIGLPDVAIERHPKDSQSPVAVLDPPVVTTAMTVNLPIPEKVKQGYLEIRDLKTREVITSIEILSPVNKRPGLGRKTYLRKRRRVLGSFTHLIELDLLRRWESMPMLGEVPESDYRVLVSDSDRRPRASLYPISLRQSLPTITVPLNPEDSPPVLDLQSVLTQVYDRSGYDYLIDYTVQPKPPLSEGDRVWLAGLL